MPRFHHHFFPLAIRCRLVRRLGPVWVMVGWAAALVTPAVATDLAPDRPLVVPTATNNYPNSFLGSSGQPEGFAVELLDAVGRVMGLKLERIVQPAVDDQKALDAGRVDIFQSYSYTPERNELVDFSASYLDLAGGMFVNRQASGIRRVEDLDGRRLLIVGLNSVGVKFAREHLPRARILYSPSGEDAMRRLDAGEADGLFLSRLTALSVAEHLKLGQVEPLGGPIAGYDVPLCFAVRKGNARLLARLNEGLAILHRTGEYDRIYRKWFGQFEPEHFTREQVIGYVAAALALALAVALWAERRQRQLRRRLSRQAEELAESRAILAEAQAFARIGHWKQMLHGGDVMWSEETYRIFERDPLAGPPEDPDEIVRHAAAPDQHRWREGVEQLIETGEPFLLELDLTLPSGHHKCLQSRTRAVREPAGPIIGLFGTIQDITERRQHDEEIAQGRRLRALGELVGGIAHEFNNLLTPILFSADAMRKEWADHPRLNTELQLIVDAASRSAELTRRLLTFGRKTEVQAQTFAVGPVVENNIALLRHTIDRRIVIESRLGPNLPLLYLSLGDLQQVLLNLMVNARDTLMERLGHPNHADWIPTILIEAEPVPRPPALPAHAPSTQAWIGVTVRDNGMGMSQPVVQRIFEPFYTTKEAGRGTGLGLATVWHLVNEFGGRIMVASEPGVGSKFTIYLPVCPPPSLSPVTPPSQAPAAPASSSRRILLVEDEESIALLLQKLLQRYGHTTTHFANGSDGWKCLAERPADFDLLLLDLNTPGMTGLELADRARQASFHGTIIVMSGRVAEEDRAVLNRLKVDAIIPKPFTIETLSATLTSLGISARRLE